jgi:hypothetical protein
VTRTQTPDVIAELEHQHARIIQLVGELGGSATDARVDKVAELREFLIMHETVEQIVVQPAVSGCSDGPELAALSVGFDPAERERMGRQLQAAEASLHQADEPLDVIVERTYRAINDVAPVDVEPVLAPAR